MLDEPTLGLDIIFRKEFYANLLNDYFDEERTILVTTHQVEEIENLLTDIMFINDGKILLDSPMESLGDTYTEVSTSGDEATRARGLGPIAEEQMFGKSVMLFEGVSREHLEGLGEIRTPSVADLFVAKVRGRGNDYSSIGTRKARDLGASLNLCYALAICQHRNPGRLTALMFARDYAAELDVAIFGAQNLAGDPERKAALTGFFLGTSWIFHYCAGDFDGFYCLDSLYAERKDKSILFWRSLPVTDAETVISKLLTAILVIPVVNCRIIGTHLVNLIVTEYLGVDEGR